jgi:hypothetical protein
VADGGVKIQCVMRLVTVQKHRYRNIRDVGKQRATAATTGHKDALNSPTNTEILPFGHSGVPATASP